MSRACSSSLALRNRFNGFVTVRKCSALPLYVLWSQYGFSMSIFRSSANALTSLLFDILRVFSAPQTCSSSHHRYTPVSFLLFHEHSPHHAVVPVLCKSAAPVGCCSFVPEVREFLLAWSSREDAQTSTVADLAPTTERFHRSQRCRSIEYSAPRVSLDLSIHALLSLLLLTPSTSLSITCTRARLLSIISRLFLPPRDGGVPMFGLQVEVLILE